MWLLNAKPAHSNPGDSAACACVAAPSPGAPSGQALAAGRSVGPLGCVPCGTLATDGCKIPYGLCPHALRENNSMALQVRIKFAQIRMQAGATITMADSRPMLGVFDAGDDQTDRLVSPVEQMQ